MNNLFKIADKYQQNPNIKVEETPRESYLQESAKTTPQKTNPNFEWSESSRQEFWKEIKQLKQLIANLRKKYDNDIQYYMMREESYWKRLQAKDDTLEKYKNQIVQLKHQLKRQEAQFQYQLKKKKIQDNIA